MSTTEELSELLLHLQSSDNNLRTTAEKQLNAHWLSVEAGVQRQTQLLTALAQFAISGPEAQRAPAAIIFRRCATKVSTHDGQVKFQTDPSSPRFLNVFSQLEPKDQENIRQIFLQGLLSSEQHPYTRRKIGDAVAELVHSNTEWPNLFVNVATAAVESTDPNTRESCFRVLCGAPEILPAQSQEGLQSVIHLLNRGFADSNEVVRTSATTAFAAFFAYLPKNTWTMFKPLLPALLNVMEPLRQQHQEEELTSVLESLITLAEIAPKMFLPVFPTLIEFALAVSGESDMDETPRMTALELVAAFADGAPNMCTREPTYVKSVVPMLLKLLTEVGLDDGDEEQPTSDAPGGGFALEWQNTNDNEAIDEMEPVHREAKLAIDRLSLSLGGYVLAPVLFNYLPLMLKSTLWRERLAGLMALSNAAEGCRDQMLPELGNILQITVPMLQDVHPRVQWSACNALGQLSTDLAPELQENYGDLVLPGLISKLRGSTFKVQAHAAAALVNFSDSVRKEIIDPYLDSLLNGLLELVRSPMEYVQEQALTTIAMVADSSQQYFTKYYDTLMPLVLNTLRADMQKSNRLLVAKGIECATLIALAVGKEVFAPHMQQLGEILLQIQQQSTAARRDTGEDEDPCSAYLVQSWGRLCRVIGPEFAPFLPVVMPPLLATAKAKADCHILDVDQAENLRDAEGWHVVKYSGQWIGIHTAWFDEKASAIELLHVYPRELGVAFWPYVAEIVNEIVLPGVKFFYNVRVRSYSCQLLPHLIYVAYQHNENDAIALWRPVLECLLNTVLQFSSETTLVFGDVFAAIAKVVEILGVKALTADDINLLSSLIPHILQGARLRLEKQANIDGPNGLNNGDEFAEVDDEDEEDEDEQDDEDMIDSCNRMIHTLLKVYGPDILKTKFSEVCALVPFFANSIDEDCQLFAIEVIGDLVEYGKETAKPALESGQWTQIPLQSIKLPDKSPNFKAICAACIGRIALHGGPSVSKLSMEALEPLLALAQSPNANEPENIDTKERSCGAIARILRTFGTTELSPSHFTLAVVEWLKTMPITHEKEGASFSYIFLAELIEKNHEVVSQHYQQIVFAIIAGLEAKTLQGKPSLYVIQHTKQLLSSLPEDKRMELFNRLSPEQQNVVRMSFS